MVVGQFNIQFGYDLTSAIKPAVAIVGVFGFHKVIATKQLT
jgi:hypothetical protein